ncbi:amino acid ABC transporter permease [Amnibacterium flavum]|uniref:Nickel transporter n=1 Tax=Amnibacterium flavum TaxID=2173173 RepID=A0A2V1HPQ7_9MICO|nr:amino acid ABC transporter permease [Amnibacterium flavum]PVZ94515.1 nickel transporter [Amnibacterium flavum]
MNGGYQFDFSAVLARYPLFFEAALLTLEILAIATVASLVIGLFAGIGLTSERWYVRGPVRAYVDLFRLTPLLVQIVTIFFLLPIVGITVNALVSGIIALSLNYAAFYAEIFKAGITSIDRGQWEASRAMGMKDSTALRRVILPQAIRRMLPPVGNMLVSLTKDTSLVSVIGVAELMSVSQTLGASTFRNLESLLVVTVFYLAINIPLSALVSYLHKKQVVNA